jgi:hypothetical protein
MKVLLEFDEKEFWLELFSIVARRETSIENEISSRTTVPERAIGPEEGGRGWVDNWKGSRFKACLRPVGVSPAHVLRLGNVKAGGSLELPHAML